MQTMLQHLKVRSLCHSTTFLFSWIVEKLFSANKDQQMINDYGRFISLRMTIYRSQFYFVKISTKLQNTFLTVLSCILSANSRNGLTCVGLKKTKKFIYFNSQAWILYFWWAFCCCFAANENKTITFLISLINSAFFRCCLKYFIGFGGLLQWIVKVNLQWFWRCLDRRPLSALKRLWVQSL